MLQNYVKIAWKVLKRNRFFSFVSLFGISLTIGILLILATLFEQLIGKHYPEDPSNHTLIVTNVTLSDDRGTNYVGTPGIRLVQNYIQNMQSPKRVAFSSAGRSTISFIRDKKLTFRLNMSCEEYWNVHKFTFLEGKPYNKEQIADKAPVAVISRSTRDAYFGEDESVIGKFIETDNSQFRVIGVIENIPQSKIQLFGDIFIPYTVEKYASNSENLVGGYYAFLEGESSSDLTRIKEEYQSVIGRVSQDLRQNPFDGTYTEMTSYAATKLEQISNIFSGGSKPDVGLLLVILGVPMLLFILLPALNLVNLNSSRIMERSSEIGVRKAFGATSLNLTVQFVIENILVTLIGGSIGLVLALVGLEIIESTGLIKYVELGLRLNVFIFAILLCLFFGILSGVLPAWRMSKIQVVNALKGISS